MKEIAEIVMVQSVNTNRMGAAGWLPVGKAAVTRMVTKREVIYEALSVLIYFVAQRNIKPLLFVVIVL